MTELEAAIAAGGQVQQPQQTELQAALAAGGQQVDPNAPAPAAPTPGIGEAIGRGAIQGATLGFGDELTGAIESILGSKTYAQSRDESRAANRAASEAHPLAYGGAELGAGLVTPVPGLGAAKAGAGLAAHALSGAAIGGLAGIGSSEADLTKGDFGGAIHDTVQSALLGGAIGAVGGKLGQKLGGAGEASEERSIKALAGGESKTSNAAWQKTKRMVNNPETRNILREPVEVEGASGKMKTTTLEREAGAAPDHIQTLVDSQASKIGDELRPIYAKADAKNGGVSLRDYVGRLDKEIADTGSMAPAEARVYKAAIGELKENAIQQWGQRNPNLLSALESDEAKTPGVRDAIMKQFDVRIPSDEVRGEATALQKIGFKTVEPLNPGLQTQVKRDMGNLVRDFVNDHVMQTLGTEDHGKLLELNKRMNAWLGVGTVAAARAEKEMAGNMKVGGTLSHLIGHGSMAAGALGAVMGHPGALAIPLAAKAVEYAPAAARTATRAAAEVDSRLASVVQAAAAGNPWAQRMVATLRQTPGGIARIAALERQSGQSPQAPAPAPMEVPNADPAVAQQ